MIKLKAQDDVTFVRELTSSAVDVPSREFEGSNDELYDTACKDGHTQDHVALLHTSRMDIVQGCQESRRCKREQSADRRTSPIIRYTSMKEGRTQDLGWRC